MICAALEMTGGTLAISIFTPGFGQMRYVSSVLSRRPTISPLDPVPSQASRSRRCCAEDVGKTVRLTVPTSSPLMPCRAEFGVEREVVVVGTTLYLLGLGVSQSAGGVLCRADYNGHTAYMVSLAVAISSLITAPLGELFGRKPVVAVSFFLFTVTSMGVALAPNVGALLALRFISGTAALMLYRDCDGKLTSCSISPRLVRLGKHVAWPCHGVGPLLAS